MFIGHNITFSLDAWKKKLHVVVKNMGTRLAYHACKVIYKSSNDRYNQCSPQEKCKA